MLSYDLWTKVVLSAEKYMNAGITPEQVKSVIERITDPASNTDSRLHPTHAGINGNWGFYIIDPDDAEGVVMRIEGELNRLLRKKREKLTEGVVS